jgi:phosphoglycolate phosphatase
MTDAVRAVLFDLDGTLLDTAPDMIGALNALRAERQLAPLAYDKLRGQVSHGAAGLVRRGFAEAGEAEFAVLRARFLELYGGRVAASTRPFPGALELLETLEGRGIVWGVVTNKPQWLTTPLLEALGLAARAGTVVCGDTLPERKPNPLPLLHAASQLAHAPAECVYVGDAERDMLAARAAGMRALVAGFGYIEPAEDPWRWPADGWLVSPLALLAWLDALASPDAAQAAQQ